MLKNKIYNYFFNEFFRNFLIILLTFTIIAWVVRAVNFLDLMVEDGYSTGIYFKYSLLNIATILGRFIPLSFLLSLTISIIKFERQQELLILWTTGLTKIKVVNIFIFIGLIVTLAQIILSLFINPYLLNKSRSLLSKTEELQINAVLKSSDFSDSFKGITFYIEKKNTNNELENIFIKDTNGTFSTITEDVTKQNNSTIVAKRGYISKEKLILFNGTIQTLNKNNEIKNFQFEKTELSLNDLSTRTIKKTKIQETSSIILLKCIFEFSDSSNLNECSQNFKNESVQALSRRAGTPLYIPLISIITSFLLIYKKEKTYSFLKKYLLFIISFVFLLFSEILLKYTGLSNLIAISYFIIPLVMSFLFYLYLWRKIITERITNE